MYCRIVAMSCWGTMNKGSDKQTCDQPWFLKSWFSETIITYSAHVFFRIKMTRAILRKITVRLVAHATRIGSYRAR
jgi:hypothetical protein